MSFACLIFADRIRLLAFFSSRPTDRLESQNAVEDMALWGNRERYRQGQQRAEKVWGTLSEGYFPHWKNLASVLVSITIMIL